MLKGQILPESSIWHCVNLKAGKSEKMENNQTSNLNNELKFKVTILKKLNLVQFE